MLIYNSWWTGVEKTSVAQYNGIWRDLCYLRTGIVEIHFIVIHTNIPPVYSGLGCSRSWANLFGTGFNTWALCLVLYEPCRINVLIIPLISSALLTSSLFQKQRLLLYTPILKSVVWTEMRPSSKTSLVLIFQVQALQNAADFPIFMNRDLNPAECNILLDAYFYVRMYVYVFTG